MIVFASFAPSDTKTKLDNRMSHPRYSTPLGGLFFTLLLAACGSDVAPDEAEALYDFNQLIVQSTGGLVGVMDMQVSKRKEKSNDREQVLYAQVTYKVNRRELETFKHQADMSAFRSGIRRPSVDRSIRTAESYDGKVEKVTMIFRQDSSNEWNLVNYAVGYKF